MKLISLSVATALCLLSSPLHAGIDADDYYLACSSMGAGAYTSSGRGIGWSTYIKLEDARKLGVPDDKLENVILVRFEKWMRATNQFGRWNSVWDSSFDCSPADVGVIERARAAKAADTYREWFDASLPASWYKRDPTDSAEIARYSKRSGAPGSNLANNASLTLVRSKSTLQDGWEDQVLQAQRAAAAALAKRIADTARGQAQTQAKLAKFFADLGKRGRAQ